VDRRQGYRWRRAAGGRIPRAPRVVSGRYLSVEERLRLADLRLSGMSQAGIAAELGRCLSTISRELTRNRSPAPARAAYAPYSPTSGPWSGPDAAGSESWNTPSCGRSSRPCWCCSGARPRSARSWAGLHPDRPEMQVSHETIYQALFVQSRGQLRADLHRQLRTGRAVRRPRGRSRPPRVPGMSANGPPKPRTVPSRALGRGPDFREYLPVSDRDTTLTTTIQTLPNQLRRSLTWDQGTELARHRAITLATDLDIYFCDPHSPWQRGNNENTNGLLRHYFQGQRPVQHSPERLTTVAA